MSTALITHTDCLNHVNPPGHPEQVARLEYILDALKDLPLNRVTAPHAADADILRVHPQAYVDDVVQAQPNAGFYQIDSDTHMSNGSVVAAYRAAGGAVRGVDMVMSGEASNVFVAVRPPGHHAETQTAMGFCLFGNVAIAAKHALEYHGAKRVVVVDFDVHHGNGTQDLLWDESRALVITSQQMPLWPGSGDVSENGAYNNVLNIPLPPNSDGNLMRAKYQELVFPQIKKFNPDIILISAGFDAHRLDPLAQLNWDEEDFAWITEKLCQIANECCQGRVVSVLEGGYDLEALAASAKAHVEILMRHAND